MNTLLRTPDLQIAPLSYDEVISACASKNVLDNVWTVDWAELEAVELLPGCRFSDDTWVIPVEWSSGGQKRKPHNRTIAFTRAIPEGWASTDRRTVDALRRIKRLTALLFLKTVQIGSQRRAPFKPSTWVKVAQNVLGAAKWSLSKPLGDAENLPPSSCPDAAARLFQCLSPSDLSAITAANRAFGGAAVRRLGALVEVGAIDDWPNAGIAAIEDKSTEWRPFNDDFLAELARAALWFTEELGPDILSCWQEVAAIETDDKGRRRSDHVGIYRKEVLARWEGKAMRLGDQFPYRINVAGIEDRIRVQSEISSWPPRDKHQVRRLLTLLQAAHLIVLLLSTAARDHEAAEFPRDCLEPSAGGFLLAGVTHKLSDDGNGEPRNWPLPKIAVTAIRQQQRLARLIHPTGKRLFVAFADRGDLDMAQTYFSVRSFANNVKLSDGRSLTSLCVGSVHAHRFRKSVARLVGLALVGANQILFDILGHRDPMMTLNYILSDPEIAADVDRVRREAAQLLAADALQSAEENGGKAAPAVLRLSRRQMPDRATAQQEANGLAHAARILSQNGEVMLVKPGTLCTKTFQQRGPCTLRAGQTDIGNCQTECVHRLELAAARADHRRSIEQILADIEPGETMSRAFSQGQLVAHLCLYDDFRAEMLARNDVQKALLDLPLALHAKLYGPSAAAAPPLS